MQEWLWCETWCGNATKKHAKTIDLCNNPLTKEPKLEGARRIVKEWPGLDEEVASFTAQVCALALPGTTWICLGNVHSFVLIVSEPSFCTHERLLCPGPRRVNEDLHSQVPGRLASATGPRRTFNSLEPFHPPSHGTAPLAASMHGRSLPKFLLACRWRRG